MALRPEYSLGHSEFNDFLFASVGEEKSGLPLTVLSALARLGLDPWGEAARLADMPKEAAARALAGAIASLPTGDWTVSDTQSIAVRLVNCLPGRGARPANPHQGRSIDDRPPKPGAGKWLMWAALAVAVLMVARHLTGA